MRVLRGFIVIYNLADFYIDHGFTVGRWSLPSIQGIEVDINKVLKQKMSPIHPWTLPSPNICLHLAKFNKKETTSELFQKEFNKIKLN